MLQFRSSLVSRETPSVRPTLHEHMFGVNHVSSVYDLNWAYTGAPEFKVLE
jgi:hypothetical protein